MKQTNNFRCAFANTPKFQQVQGKGKIVKKTWIQDCHTERKRLPWRRYALDRNDIGKPESEDEICEKTEENENEIEIEEPQESEPEEMQTSQILNKGDTEDEIEKIIEQQRTKRNGDKTISVENNEARRDKNDKSSSNKNVKTNRDEYVSGSDTEDEVEKIIAQQKTKAENSMTENKTKKDKINSDEKTNKERESSDKNYKINQEYVSGSDTEDEIEKIITKQKAKAGNTKTEGNKTSSDKNNKTYKEENDGNEKVKNGDNVASSSEKIDPFDMDTDEERLEKNPKDLTETIPSIFSKDLFYVDEVFTENEKNKIERLIKAFDGIVLSRVNNILDYVITNEESVDSWKEKCSSAKFVTSLWIYACHNEQQLVPIDKYTLS